MEINNKQNKGRLTYLDAAKGIGMLLIILSHLSYLSNPVVSLGNSFFLAIFYIISGYLFSLKKNVNKKSYIYSRLKSLGIPYIFFSIIAIIWFVLRAFIRGEFALSDLLNNIFRTVSLRGLMTLWFLPTLFIAELFFIYLILDRTKGIRIIILTAIPLICSALALFFHYANINISTSYIPLTILKSAVAVWFFSIGYYSLEYLINLPAGLLVILGGVNIFLSLLNTDVDLNLFQLGKYPLYFFVSGVIGSIVLIRSLKALSRKLKMKLLVFCGKYSLFIMATHIYITRIIVSLLKRIIIFKSATLWYYVFCVICLAAIVSLEAILIHGWEFIKSCLWKKLPENHVIRRIIPYI